MKGCKLVFTAGGQVVDTFVANHQGLIAAQRAAEARARSLSKQLTTVGLICPGKDIEVLVRCNAKRCASGGASLLGRSRRARRRRRR